MDDEPTSGEERALAVYLATAFGEIDPVAFINGYRAAVAIVENRIAWLTEEVERKPTSYPDSEAQIGHRMERNVLQSILETFKEGGQ